MTRRLRFIYLGLCLILLLGLGYYVTGNFQFILNDFWFTSGLLLLILLSLVTQPHFSKETQIFVNAVTGFLSLLIVPIENRELIFWIFVFVTLYLALSSYVIILLRSKPIAFENKWIQLTSRINREIGKPRSLFSAFFIWGAMSQFGANSKGFNTLLLFWIIFMLINIPSIAKSISTFFESKEVNISKSSLGKIFGIQSKNTFLVKLFEEREERLNIFDFVEFKYSIDETNRIRKGLILDTYLLNQEQWIKVLTTNELNNIYGNTNFYTNHKEDVVYKIDERPDDDYLERFVGIITENSTINKIRFIYNSNTPISEGQLLQVSVQNHQVLYQIVEGITRIEILEHKNQTGLIIGEAIQLGTWNADKTLFEQFGWVPSINSPVFLSSDIDAVSHKDSEYTIGYIPETNYPVVLNKETSITHHTAILGITGSGKSVFTRNLIRQIATEETKVIIIDLTGEYKDKMKGLNSIILDKNAQNAFTAIENLAKEKAKYQSNWRHEYIDEQEDIIKREFYLSIKSFLEGEHSVSVFELPDISNNSNVLDYTKWFFYALFKTAKTKNNFGKRVCVVLEEAHTVIPELNSMGVSDFASKASVNTIAQIALQGRKYNIGFYVIAQRTANVSKTVLTQCNSIIAFQELDKTSSDFLSNYMGQEFVKILPNLNFRQAIAVGKAFKSNVPMIFEVPEINEEE